MQVILDIPDKLAAQISASGKEPSRLALEALLVDGYRSGKLFEGDLREMLGFETAMEVHALLKDHDVPLDYSLEDFEQDARTLADLRGNSSSSAA